MAMVGEMVTLEEEIITMAMAVMEVAMEVTVMVIVEDQGLEKILETIPFPPGL